MNDRGFVSNTETVVSTLKHASSENVEVPTVRVPAGSIGWSNPVNSCQWLPSRNRSSKGRGSPDGTRVAEKVAAPAGSPLPFRSGIEPARTLPFHVTTTGWSKSRNKSGVPVVLPSAKKSMPASGPNSSDTEAEKNTKPPPLVAAIPSQKMPTLWSVNRVTRPADATEGRARTSVSEASTASTRLIRTSLLASRGAGWSGPRTSSCIRRARVTGARAPTCGEPTARSSRCRLGPPATLLPARSDGPPPDDQGRADVCPRCAGAVSAAACTVRTRRARGPGWRRPPWSVDRPSEA